MSCHVTHGLPSFATTHHVMSSDKLHRGPRSRDGTIRDYGLAGLANACAHPVLAGRAKELGAPEILRNFLERNSTEASAPAASSRWRGGRLLRSWAGQRQRVETALARLNEAGFRGGGSGDVEEGGDGGSGKLQFFTFKWGVHPSVRVGFSARGKVCAVAGCLFWASIVYLALRPIIFT